MIIMLLYRLVVIERCQRKQKGQQGRRKYLKECGVGLELNCDRRFPEAQKKATDKVIISFRFHLIG